MTWTIEMNAKELACKAEIERVEGKWASQKEAAARLGISERQFRRILRRYRLEGVAGLVSRKRGVPSNRKMEDAIREIVEDFINDPLLRGFGPTLMAEKIEQMKGIRLSKETVRKMMIEAGVWKAKVRKKVEPHYARPRRKHRGELVQIDGSEHAWLEDRGPKATLLVFVDDATSQILAAEFVPEECFYSYGNLCQRYFREHGVPQAFYSDRFSVFRVNRRDNIRYEPVTQFQRAVSALDIELICANSPQAKGRVERANQTLQDRLIKEMRLLGINDYEQANLYLPEFIRSYNRNFAVSPASSLDFHRPLDETLDLPFLFSIHDFRKVTKTLQINYAGRVYQVVTSHPAYFYADQEVLITCDASGFVSAWFHGNLLILEEVEKRSRQVAIVSSKSESTNPLPPAYDHPWRTYGKKINGKPVLTTLSSQ
ncbi:MAG: ISNCY family transposase [Spirochaetales bacterium]|jgi:transposase|nr:ISNCY family transposase [Spirochaetales bacterium]